MCADKTIDPVVNHYAEGDAAGRILAALHAAGKNVDALTPDDIAAVDEFHIRGRDATVELAEMARLAPDDHLLDVGCGIGGAARFLATTYGCRVTAIDLTADFCRAATLLNQRSGLHDAITVRQANALDLPFEDRSFDAVWMQHCNMNIEDKPTLFRELHRVLVPGGRAAIYEIVGDATGIRYPVPWATEASTSFVVPQQGLQTLLSGAGLTPRVWHDVTEKARLWAKAVAKSAGREPPPLGLHVPMGSRIGEMLGNLVRGLEEGHIEVVMAVLTKSAEE